MTEPVSAPGAEPLLRTENLSKHFRIGSALSRLTLHAVDDVSLAIGEREIVALAGESGSGKSTIARLLAKLYKPTSGEIYFQGRPVSRMRSRKRHPALHRAGPDGLPGPVQLDQPGATGSRTACCAASSCTGRNCPPRSGRPRRSGCSRRSACPRPGTCCSATRTS